MGANTILSEEPLVSIGMPVFNGEPYVSQALDSLLAQDHKNFELIISDNASTDATSAICRGRAAEDKRIRYVRHDHNIGAIGNFNSVLGEATAEYFMWAAADDMWKPRYISTVLAKLLSEPSAVLAFSAFENVGRQAEHVRAYPDLFDLPEGSQFIRLRSYMCQDEKLGKANLIYGLTRRRDLLSAVELNAWQRGVWGSDMLLVFRLLTIGRLVVVNELLFQKRLIDSPPNESFSPVERILLRSLLGRSAAIRSSLRERLPYFGAYASIVAAADLPTIEKARLQAAVANRALKLIWTEVVRELIRPALATASRHAKSGQPVLRRRSSKQSARHDDRPLHSQFHPSSDLAAGAPPAEGASAADPRDAPTR
jgi:glycosyltransferase involved in cell wall biosynthesis